jgi:CheY-like chemotaxis protein
LVLLDVMMPGMDGPATLCRLQELPSMEGIPVVFMTAKVQPQEVQEYLALGAVEVVAKPFDPMTLPTTLREIWSRPRG